MRQRLRQRGRPGSCSGQGRRLQRLRCLPPRTGRLAEELQAHPAAAGQPRTEWIGENKALVKLVTSLLVQIAPPLISDRAVLDRIAAIIAGVLAEASARI
jgi:hypothetical protein